MNKGNNKKLRKIVNYYGIDRQLKYLQSEVFELNEAIIKRNNQGLMESVAQGIVSAFSTILDVKLIDNSKEHIKEELADVMVMLKQIQLFYDIPTSDIEEIMKLKIDRQLERIEEENKNDK